MVKEVLEVVKSGVMSVGWNDTFIVLVQEVDGSTKNTQFQPISMYNMVYKIILKNVNHMPKGYFAEGDWTDGKCFCVG